MFLGWFSPSTLTLLPVFPLTLLPVLPLTVVFSVVLPGVVIIATIHGQ